MTNLIKFPIDKARWSQDDLDALEGKEQLEKIFHLNEEFKKNPNVSTMTIASADHRNIGGGMSGPYDVYSRERLAKEYAEWKEKWGDNVPEVWEGRLSPRALEENK